MAPKKTRFIFPLIITVALCLVIVVVVMWNIVSSMQNQTAQHYQLIQKDVLQISSYVIKPITAFYKIDNFKFSNDLKQNIKSLQNLSKSIAGLHEIAYSINDDVLEKLPLDDPLLLHIQLSEIQPKLQSVKEFNDSFFQSLNKVTTNIGLRALIEKNRNNITKSISILEEYQHLHTQLESHFFLIRKTNVLAIIERLNVFFYVLAILLVLTGLLSFLYIYEKVKLQKTLLTSHHLLEDKVKERVSDLKISNEQLAKEIEEREQIEFELRLKSDALENSLNAFDIIDESGRFVYVNKAYVDMWGYSNKNEILKTLPVLHCQDPDIPRQIIEELKINKSCIREFVAQRKDGSVFDVLMYARLDKDENGREIYPSTSIDITERKKAETALLINRKELQNLLQTIQAAVIVHDVSLNRITSCNQAASNILGLTEDEIAGRCTLDSDWGFVDEVGGKIAAEDYPVNIVSRTQKPLLDYVIGIPNSTGKGTVWVIVNANPQFDQNGVLIEVIVSAMDITELKNIQETLKEKDKQLTQSQKIESIGNLAGGIAHEFNNMLAIIMGNNELVMEELPKGGRARKRTEEIQIAGVRAREVVKQLLTFSRKDNAAKKVMDFNVVIQDCIKLIRSTTPANIKIQQVLPDTKFPVMCNETQISQLLINLCSNAVDASPEKGGEITIELLTETIGEMPNDHWTSVKPGNYIKLVVRDNGCGMDREVLDRVFEPYFTTKKAGEGTGIGMAVVHGIVERHGGKIIVDSLPSQGTTFSILIPVYENPFDEQKTAEKNTLPVGNECVLYVDDEPSIAKIGKRYLENLGYSAESTTDPNQALEMLRRDPSKFDLVITDMAMPGITGEQLIIEILKIRPDMLTIICTGYSARITEKEATEIGVDAYIMKPINKAELAKVLRNVFDKIERA